MKNEMDRARSSDLRLGRRKKIITIQHFQADWESRETIQQ